METKSCKTHCFLLIKVNSREIPLKDDSPLHFACSQRDNKRLHEHLLFLDYCYRQPKTWVQSFVPLFWWRREESGNLVVPPRQMLDRCDRWLLPVIAINIRLRCNCVCLCVSVCLSDRDDWHLFACGRVREGGSELRVCVCGKHCAEDNSRK